MVILNIAFIIVIVVIIIVFIIYDLIVICDELLGNFYEKDLMFFFEIRK